MVGEPVRLYAPVPVDNMFGLPVPPDLVVPLYEVPEIVFAEPEPLRKILPHNVVARSFHSVSASVESAVLLVCHLINPPALKKYLCAAALAQLIVCVKVIVHGLVPEPVAVVLLVVPLQLAC